MRGKLAEVWEEFRSVFVGRVKLLDSLAPLVAYLVVQSLSGPLAGLAVASAFGLGFALFRVARSEGVGYAVGGWSAAALSAGGALVSGSAGSALWADMIRNGVTVLVCVGSTLVRRPLVAFSSYVARRWPLGWYWHDRVRPAYADVTLAWGLFYLAKIGVQYLLVTFGGARAQAVGQLALGWPAMVALLIASYLYGVARLRRLRGPSVTEYEMMAPEPWEGQQRGF